MNIIANLLTFAETGGWHPIIPAVIIATPIIFLFVIFFRWLANNDKKKYLELQTRIEKDTNPIYAKWYRSYDRTPPKGTKAIILDEDRWVVVQWDKEKDSLVIFTPLGHKDRKSVSHQGINAKFEEAKEVKIEDLARIH
jgi:hypothetical protein